MTARRPVLLLALASLSGCGGKVIDTGAIDAGMHDDSTATDTTFGDTSIADATSSDVAFEAPGADVGPPSDAISIDAAAADASTSCDGYKVTGPPDGPPEKPICGDAEPFSGWAAAMLACLVDRCDAADGMAPWCGTISLTFDGTGYESDYREDGPGTGGCVKYQGAYRAWPCEALRTVTVTRPCPG
jgi:hypothetical protein